MPKRLPLSEPFISGNEWKYVKECLDTAWVSYKGHFVAEFEEKFADYVGAKYAIAMSSGTAAIHMALRALECAPGDEVILPGLTFIASANPVKYEKADPVFVDVQRSTWGIDPLEIPKIVGPKTRFVMSVDLLGHPADYGALEPVCRRQGLTLIEDATEALGAFAHGKACGLFGTMAAFSFNGNKVITAGGGGMLVTNDEALAGRARFLSTQAREGPEYHHPDVGYNYRLTNVQAAIGLAQLERLDEFLDIRRRHAAIYGKRLHGLPGVTCAPSEPWAKSSFWLYTILVAPPFALSKSALLERLASHAIEARPVFQPLPDQPPFRGARQTACTEVRRIYEHAVSLPSSTSLSEADIHRVCDVIEQAATRRAS
jgi:perosamine synthetase